MYQEIPSLAAILLEESYVLDIEAHPTTVEFSVDFVLAPEHPEYCPPGSDESHCYRRGRLRFSGVTRCLWSNQGAPPARDATGEVDYGNVDSFEWDRAGYSLEGDWGRMELIAEQVGVRLE
jgi:hypothetical protein